MEFINKTSYRMTRNVGILMSTLSTRLLTSILPAWCRQLPAMVVLRLQVNHLHPPRPLITSSPNSKYSSKCKFRCRYSNSNSSSKRLTIRISIDSISNSFRNISSNRFRCWMRLMRMRRLATSSIKATAAVAVAKTNRKCLRYIRSSSKRSHSIRYPVTCVCTIQINSNNSS